MYEVASNSRELAIARAHGHEPKWWTFGLYAENRFPKFPREQAIAYERGRRYSIGDEKGAESAVDHLVDPKTGKLQ